ncbi:hypothetical protein P8935_22980 [Telmatobacter sp. DSM 110680]|uniref:Uncharacterized protein n=1 Tax=Telmatobacter sp. DSM 110680 TaxID=3036704 RepID=A0AAU7DKW6_9BACT
MGKNSRAEQNRTPTPVPRSSLFVELFLNGWLWVSVAGFILLMYGTSFIFNRQWNHRVFHPWAIVFGVVLVVISFVKQKGDGEMR